MKFCPRCRTGNAETAKFCKHCGAPVLDTERAATQRWAPVATSSPEQKAALNDTRRVARIDALFAGRDQLLIGRDPENDISLPHPSISRTHALLVRTQEKLRLVDLGSVNGVFVNGSRIRDFAVLRDGDQISIGPFLFSFVGERVFSVDNSHRLRLEAHRLERVIRLESGGTKKLLTDIDLVIEPGEFVSLLGPSGSGKSTLMDCLNGRRRATGGKVLFNGEDFYRHYSSFRQSLGYVPQKDIIHTQLTVERALYYTARLRLPADTRPSELQARINDVIERMELEPHRQTLIANLSGGQIKRVSLGAELLAQPAMLYIDEATSGLDAGTEARMMRLFRRLADSGQSVLCITHNIENVNCCHLILVLMRGRVVYYGPPDQAPSYFGVERLSDVYDRLSEREPEAWNAQFFASAQYAEYIAKRLNRAAPLRIDESATTSAADHSLPDLPKQPSEVPKPPRPKMRHQFRVLTARYLDLLWADKRALLMLFLQAPIVAAFVLLGFVNKPFEKQVVAPRKLTENERLALQVTIPIIRTEHPQTARIGQTILDTDLPVIPDQVIVDPRFNYMLLFIIGIIVMWFGCNNAAKEIVKEEAVYARERAINLSIPPYLAGKFLIQSLITALQAVLLVGMIYGVLELCKLCWGHDAPASCYHLPYPELLGVLVLLGMTGTALGLFLSAGVSTPDRANTLLPYVLIPQIILGGGILQVNTDPLRLIAVTLSPVYWAYRGIRTGETSMPESLPFRYEYDDAVWIPCLALLIQTSILLLLTAAALKRKDYLTR